jgi:phosphoglycolate phosphatase
LKTSFNFNDVSHLIFDWDGTVMDSANKIVVCMQKAAALSDLPTPSAEQVHQIIGISLVPAIQRLFGIDQQKAIVVKEHYREVFLQEDSTPCELFEGAKATLQTLYQHFTLGVATGKARRGLDRAFDSSDTRHLFASSITADDAESKPSSDMLEKLLSEWKIKPSNAIMIGDTHYDMKMAEDIGMQRIGVSYGVHSLNQLSAHSPIAIVDSFNELEDLLLAAPNRNKY